MASFAGFDEFTPKNFNWLYENHLDKGVFILFSIDDIQILGLHGKKVETTLSTLGTLTKDVEKMKTKFGQLERDFKGFKNAK